MPRATRRPCERRNLPEGSRSVSHAPEYQFCMFQAAPGVRQGSFIADRRIQRHRREVSHRACHVVAESENAASCAKQEGVEIIGRDERIRTSDPHTPSVMRYQAALRPDRRAPPKRIARKLQGLSGGVVRGVSGRACMLLLARGRSGYHVACPAGNWFLDGLRRRISAGQSFGPCPASCRRTSTARRCSSPYNRRTR